MKNILLVLVFLAAVSCKDEAKKETVENTETAPKVEAAAAVVYPNLEDAPAELNYIFENGYEFAEDIKVNYIALHSKGVDEYQLIFGLDENSNLERLKAPLRVSAVFYATNPVLFKDKIYQDRKARQVPNVCKVSILDKEHVLTVDFNMIPKKFSQVKFYFYNDNGVVNDKMLTVRNIDLSK